MAISSCIGMRSWTLGTMQLGFYSAYDAACGIVRRFRSVYEIIRDVIHRRCVGISIRSTVIVRVSEIFKIMCHCNALFERINWIICARARAHTFLREDLLPLFRSLLFFQDITPPQRDLHNCERLFVLVSWPPHTRFRTLGALL